MKIHLIRESSFKPESFNAVVDLLLQFPGPVKFISHEAPVEYNDDELTLDLWDQEKIMTKQLMFTESCVMPVRQVSWETIFAHCDEARALYRIPDNEPVVLLTHYANEFNWFQGADPTGRKNLFVQTSMWDLFVTVDLVYPVVYQVATIPIKILMYNDFSERKRMAHQTPRSCINDFCGNKAEITMKLRTADICPECLEIITQKKIDPLITTQTFTILEGIRKHFTYYSALSGSSAPARLEVNYRERTFTLPQLGILLPFGPMEKTVYHLFLNHPEGIAYAALPNDYRDELITLYSNYSDTESIATMQSRINKICTDRDSMSNIISRIRRKIESTLPKTIVKYYIISGENGRKQKIRLEKKWIVLK